MTKRKRLPILQLRLLRRVRRYWLNLAPRTAILRTARALERRGLVYITPNRSIGGFDVRPRVST